MSDNADYDVYGDMEQCEYCGEWPSARRGWISVEERLPEEGQTVVCYVPNLGLRFASKLPAILSKPIGIRPEGCHGFDEAVTHWMPLPEPPK